MPNFALFSESGEYSFTQLKDLAAALSFQISRDVKPWWAHQTNVIAWPSKASAPVDAWKLQIESDIGDPSAAGFHSDENNQPYAVIQYTGNWDEDCITVSHEAVEMLLDPSGNWLAAPVPLEFITGGDPGVLIRPLIEACDPCESFSYRVEGILVSDFTLPAYFQGPDPKRFHAGSFLNKCGPLEVAKDGYLSWLNLSDNHWWQLQYGESITDLGPNDKKARGGKSLREWIDGFRKDRQPVTKS